jgi:hypothetical protein
MSRLARPLSLSIYIYIHLFLLHIFPARRIVVGGGTRNANNDLPFGARIEGLLVNVEDSTGLLTHCKLTELIGEGE